MSRQISLGDRGRVPFAMIGVLLVVSSALFAAGIDPNPGPPEPAVDLTMERTTADTRAALRGATASTAVAAASDPVVTPSDTPYGRVVGDGDSFENALKARIYLAARERFEAVEQSHRGVTGRVSLPEPETPGGLAAAIDRVSVARAGANGERLRVTVSNVTQTAHHEGGVVGRRNRTVTVVVDSPVLVAHDRVEEFQQRLDAGITKPGLAQKLTARLYAVAWARGYAQYGGAPIENVVSNRHVGLLTNGAVLGVQRSVFGRSDPDGRRAHRAAVANAALSTAIGEAPDPASEVGSLLQEQVNPGSSDREGIANLGSNASAPASNETTNVTVGETAVTAFMPFTYRGEPSPVGVPLVAGTTVTGTLDTSDVLNRTTRRVYSARVRTLSAVESLNENDPDRPPRPDEPGDWELENSSTTATVTNVEPATAAPDVTVPENAHTFLEYGRRVTVTYSHVATWEDAENHSIERDTYDNLTGTTLVRVTVVGQHAPTRFVPNHTIEHVHEPYSGAGQNLANVGDRVNATVADRGGPNELAAEAALGHLNTSAIPVYGRRPGNFSEQVYPSLIELREEIRAIDVTVQRDDLGTYEVNPAALLAAKVRDRREELVGTPDEYETVAAKARYELRSMYVTWVIAELERRAQRHRDQESDFADALSNAGDVSIGDLRDGTDARRVEETEPGSEGLQFRVDGAPPYLTRSAVDHSDVAAVENGTEVYPLKAENVNVFTIPYGDATDGIISWITGALSGQRTKLRTGANALGAARSAENATGNESVAAARSTLGNQVNASLRRVKAAARATLRYQGIGNSTVGRREIVDRAFARWDDTKSKALAVANRTVVDAVVAEAAAHERTDLSGMDRDVLRIRLRGTLTATLGSSGGTVSGPAVTEATDRIKNTVGNYTQRKLNQEVEKRLNSSVSSMPAGLPILPAPGYWAVTANVWIVNVRGEYERFAVETPRRTPTPGDASLSYVRDGANVTLDVDGDGTDELLGRSDRVGFDVSTAVVVVVPPGGAGIGDVDGNLQERSPGWERVVADRQGTDASMRNASARWDLPVEDYRRLANGMGVLVVTDRGDYEVVNETVADHIRPEREADDGPRARPAGNRVPGTGVPGRLRRRVTVTCIPTPKEDYAQRRVRVGGRVDAGGATRGVSGTGA